MSETTVDSMNLHLEKPEVKIDTRVSRRMKQKAQEIAGKLNMKVSDYTRLALNERISRDSTIIKR